MDDTVSDPTGEVVLSEMLNGENENFSSPSQLQDATMDNNIFRSPAYNTMPYGENVSPSHSRSFKEYEEQFTALRKENFNLKLRIYFLEEKNPSIAGSPDGSESLFKQNVDLKVEIESLRKELQEKQELVCQAAKAMEIMEEEQKKYENSAGSKIDELQNRIRFLEMEIETFDNNHHSNINDQIHYNSLSGSETSHCNDPNNATTTLSLHHSALAQKNQLKINELLLKIEELETIITEKDNQFKEISKNLDKISNENFELKEKLEETDKNSEIIEKAKIVIKKIKSEFSGKMLDYILENTNMKSEIENLKFDVMESRSLFQEKTDFIETLNENEKLKLDIYAIKQELADKLCLLEEADEKLKAHDNAFVLVQKLSKRKIDLEAEIQNLKQSISDEKLKNEEKHNNKPNEQKLTTIDFSKEKEILTLSIKVSQLNKEILTLNDNLKQKTIYLQTIVNKELLFKNGEIERLTKLLGQGKIPKSPSFNSNIQLQQSFTDDQYLTALKQNELLQSHLIELMEQLVKRRNIETSISIETEKLQNEIKEANERAAQAISWQKNCSNVCEILTRHLEELAGFLDSLLNNKDANIGTDRRIAMRKAVDRSLDLSKNLNISLCGNESSQLIQNTSGLSFINNSQMDVNSLSDLLNQSLFNSSYQDIVASQNEVNETQKRIIKELQEEIALLKGNGKLNKKQRRESKERKSFNINIEQNDLNQNENNENNNHNSESESWSEPDRNVSLARIGLDDVNKIINSKTSNETSTESDSDNYDSKKSRQSLLKLEELLLEKENKILVQQCQIVEIDNELKRERLKFNQKVEKINEQMISIETNLKDKINEIDLLKTELSEKSNQLKDLEIVKVNLWISETKLNNMKTETDNLNSKHRKEIENYKIDQSKFELNQIELRENYEQLLKQKEKEIKDNYILKTEYEILEKEIIKLNKNLNENLNSSMEYSKLKDDYKILELNSRKLKKQLDELTIESSKIILDRTKVVNEKSEIENKQRELEMEILRLSPRKCLQIQSISSSESNNENQEDFIERIHNSSPDLGIESDDLKANKYSSKLERSMLGTLEFNENNIIHDCKKVELENVELKKKIVNLKRYLVNTCQNLKKANERKELVEKEIKHQLSKTTNVLKSVKTNIGNMSSNLMNNVEEKEN